VNGAPVLTATLDFVVPAWLSGVGIAPNIEVTWFEIVATVNFDGTYTVVANVQASGPQGIGDVSGDMKSQVESDINKVLSSKGITPDKIKSAIANFFVPLLRLSGWLQPARHLGIEAGLPYYADGHIQQYAIEGNSLIVTYYQVPRASVAK
jgi:hypothetical protein